jgi:hypothetical protein
MQTDTGGKSDEAESRGLVDDWVKALPASFARSLRTRGENDRMMKFVNPK